jgi:hypothetical protein
MSFICLAKADTLLLVSDVLQLLFVDITTCAAASEAELVRFLSVLRSSGLFSFVVALYPYTRLEKIFFQKNVATIFN